MNGVSVVDVDDCNSSFVDVADCEDSVGTLDNVMVESAVVELVSVV